MQQFGARDGTRPQEWPLQTAPAASAGLMKEGNKMQNIYLSVLYKKFPVIKCILQIIEKDKTFGMHILERKKPNTLK